jgi:hypothetical protein
LGSAPPSKHKAPTLKADRRSSSRFTPRTRRTGGGLTPRPNNPLDMDGSQRKSPAIRARPIRRIREVLRPRDRGLRLRAPEARRTDLARLFPATRWRSSSRRIRSRSTTSKASRPVGTRVSCRAKAAGWHPSSVSGTGCDRPRLRSHPIACSWASLSSQRRDAVRPAAWMGLHACVARPMPSRVETYGVRDRRSTHRERARRTP